VNTFEADLGKDELFGSDLPEHRLEPSPADIILESDKLELSGRRVQDTDTE
jgi:hypothetical protein